MKNTVFTFGIIAGILIVMLSALIFILMGNDSGHTGSEVLGYVVMVVSLSIIFVAIKQYRDREQGGVISFKKAFLIGISVSVVAGIIYVINWEVYLQFVIDGDFIDNYQSGILDEMVANGATEEELTEIRAQHEQFSNLYDKLWFRIPITFLEIFPVGLIISLISAGLLRKNDFMPGDISETAAPSAS